MESELLTLTITDRNLSIILAKWPHTASQLSNRYLPLLEDQVCEVGANLKKHTHTFTAIVEWGHYYKRDVII